MSLFASSSSSSFVAPAPPAQSKSLKAPFRPGKVPARPLPQAQGKPALARTLSGLPSPDASPERVRHPVIAAPRHLDPALDDPFLQPSSSSIFIPRPSQPKQQAQQQQQRQRTTSHNGFGLPSPSRSPQRPVATRKPDLSRIAIPPGVGFMGATGLAKGSTLEEQMDVDESEEEDVDLDNPFLDHSSKKGAPPRREMRKMEAPTKMTYVFRGKKLVLDLPLAALMAPEDPTESPFPLPGPRLLFPPAPAEAPVTPPPSAPSAELLMRMRKEHQEEERMGGHVEMRGAGLRTPRTERKQGAKRVFGDAGAGREEKKLRAF